MSQASRARTVIRDGLESKRVPGLNGRDLLAVCRDRGRWAPKVAGAVKADRSDSQWLPRSDGIDLRANAGADFALFAVVPSARCLRAESFIADGPDMCAFARSSFVTAAALAFDKAAVTSDVSSFDLRFFPAPLLAATRSPCFAALPGSLIVCWAVCPCAAAEVVDVISLRSFLVCLSILFHCFLSSVSKFCRLCGTTVEPSLNASSNLSFATDFVLDGRKP